MYSNKSALPIDSMSWMAIFHKFFHSKENKSVKIFQIHLTINNIIINQAQLYLIHRAMLTLEITLT